MAVVATPPVVGTDPFNDERKKFQLGERSISPADMILDPGADLDDGSTLASSGSTTYDNYLYVAAGRQGLWIVDADVAASTTVNRAARVDDSGNPLANPSNPTQNSDRFCNSVEIVQFGTQTYLLATFARRAASRFRIYRIEDVRAVLGASNGTGGELGNEIAPICDIPITKHPQIHPTPMSVLPAKQYFRSYPVDMVAGTVNGATDTVFVYVAMLTDGLLRLEIERTGPTTMVVGKAWGPYFGDASSYATTIPAGANDNRAYYSHFNWFNKQTNPDVLERSEPPLFYTVAYHDNSVDGAGKQHGEKLYVGIEPIGLVVFDVSNQFAWSHDMPIDHHEGIRMPFEGDVAAGLSNQGAWEEDIVVHDPIVSGTSVRDYLSYPREIQVVDVPSGGLHVLATYDDYALMANSPHRLEGFAFTDEFGYGAVTYSVQGRATAFGVTRIWDVDDFPGASQDIAHTPHVKLDIGGDALFAPPLQSNQLGALNGPANRLEFAHNRRVQVATANSMVIDKSMSMQNITTNEIPLVEAPIVQTRARNQIRGFRGFGIGECLVDSRIIMTSDNDGFPRDGVPIIMGAAGSRSITTIYENPGPTGTDTTWASGVMRGHHNQWIDHGSPAFQQMMIGEGSATGEDLGRYRVSVQTLVPMGSSNPTLNEKRVQFAQPFDRWEDKGRDFFLGGMVDDRYDAFVQSTYGGMGSSVDGAEFVFLWRQETPDGIIWGRRDKLVDLVTDPTLADGALLLQDNLTSVELRQLNTHPEFDEFPSDSSSEAAVAKKWFHNNGRPSAYRQRTKTWAPKMIHIDAADRWVLAVPCGVSVLGSSEFPDLDDVRIGTLAYDKLEETTVNGVTGDPGWFPDVGSLEAVNRDRGLIQFWDFTDPESTSLTDPLAVRGADSGLPRIYLPLSNEVAGAPNGVAPSSMAWLVEGVERTIAGESRTFAIVADWLGAIHCYEITNLFDASNNEPELLASWAAPLGKQDVLSNNVRDIVIDQIGDDVIVYVAVQRVGVRGLRLDFDSSGGASFVEVAKIDDHTEPLALHLRHVAGTTERLLYIVDSRKALRVYSSN